MASIAFERAKKEEAAVFIVVFDFRNDSVECNSIAMM